MLGLLPLLSLILLGLSAYTLAPKDRLLRESILIGFLLWGGIITGVMEVLSIFHCLTFQWVLFCWATVLAGCAFVILMRWKYLEASLKVGHKLSLIEKFFLFGAVLIVACLWLIAFFAPPNTLDAMTYHMSRVVHWIQNHTVAYYPTNIFRQLFYPPGAEYEIFQFQVLSKTDQWSNCVQCLSMIGSLVAVSLIAKELGAGRRGQILSVIIAATIPMGILQATSTQTDYVVTWWLSVFIYFFSRWRRRQTWGNTLWMAMAAGLAFLVKGTGVVYALPFLFWILGIVVRRIGPKILAMLAVFVMVVGVLNSGTIYRNAKFFHGHSHMLMPVSGAAVHMYKGMDSIINERFGWPEFWANALRNTGMELATPWFGINQTIYRFLQGTADALHVDMNDKSASFQGAVFEAPHFCIFEEGTPSTLHLILWMVVIVLMLFFPSVRNKETVCYLWALVGALIALNLIIKWQYWSARFHLPFFVMAAPLIGAVFEKIPFRAMVAVVMTCLMACAAPFVFSNPMKSFVTVGNIMHQKDRAEEYFDPSLTAQYRNIRDGLKKMQCRDVGLVLGESVKEYPWWVVFDPSNDGSMRLEHIGVNSHLSPLEYPLGKFDPCAIIAVSYSYPNQAYQLGQNTYVKLFSQGKDAAETDIFLRIK